MSLKLINLNEDLNRLLNEGYGIKISAGHLLLNHIPYVNTSKEIKYGTLVSTLNLAGNKVQKPDTHVAYFMGDTPCNKDGTPLSAIINSSSVQQLTKDIKIDHMFSSKPRTGYSNYYEKMTTYVNIISTPAKSIDKSITEKTFEPIEIENNETSFNYIDTNSSRANIQNISQKLSELKIGIIGLGGTGSYILDLISKTPVKEIHLFDGDMFYTHNAFRAPGAPTIETLQETFKKTDYFKGLYSNMHKNIISHNEYINESNFQDLVRMDFIFMCFESDQLKESLIDYLRNLNTPFIDVGMGIQKIDEELIGIIRVTSVTDKKFDHAKKRISLGPVTKNDEYSKNIQIAELNAFNAALAVIKWKKLFGFYQDLEKENHITYSINVNLLTSDEIET